MNPDLRNTYYVVESLINIITRFSVPCFVLLSGAFVLRNQRNRNFKYFYQKSSFKILLPFLGVVVIYFCISSAYSMNVINPVKGILTGSFYNLWYIYMLCGLYICAPFIIRIKEMLTDHQYKLITVCSIMLAVISQARSHYTIAFSGGVIVAYLAYFLAGDVISSLSKPSKRECIILLFSIAILIGITFLIRYKGFSYYLFDAYTNFFSPTIMIFSLSLFYLFKAISIDFDCNWISQRTFYIYLFHTLVIKLSELLLKYYFPSNEILSIFLLILITFIGALFLSIGYDLFWQWLEKKHSARRLWYEFCDRISAKYFY
jgi:surface polysaccharide O-acyltransferase-like enzyme